jgi:hypothetical protein
MRQHAFHSSRVRAPAAHAFVDVDSDALTAAIAAASASLFVLVAGFAAPTALPFLRGELGFVENASAIAYVVGVFFAIAAARRASGYARAHWVMWAVFCVLFFGEETSWMQHWIGYATPESVRAINVQSEFNLHNLKIVSPEDRVFSGRGAVFSWRHLLSAQHVFNLGFIAYFLALPLLARTRRVRDLMRRFGVPRIGMRFVAAVWVPIAVSIALTIAERGAESEKSLIAETREMFFALAIMWFIAAAYYAIRGAHARSAVAGAAKPLSDDEEAAVV